MLYTTICIILSSTFLFCFKNIYKFIQIQEKIKKNTDYLLTINKRGAIIDKNKNKLPILNSIDLGSVILKCKEDLNLSGLKILDVNFNFGIITLFREGDMIIFLLKENIDSLSKDNFISTAITNNKGTIESYTNSLENSFKITGGKNLESNFEI